MIRQIIIENYKSIHKATIDLAPINVLIGANGAGKSNLISFFELTSNRGLPEIVYLEVVSTLYLLIMLSMNISALIKLFLLSIIYFTCNYSTMTGDIQCMAIYPFFKV